MALRSISNRRGFFSDYWLGTLTTARERDRARLTPAQARRTLERLRRMLDTVNGTEVADLTTFRERFARPLLGEILGFTLEEHAQEPRLRPLKAHDANGSVLAATYLLLRQKSWMRHVPDGCSTRDS